MSTRNPMNERYQSEERRGVTKKSAASAKPKTKAAASVYIKPTEKTPQEKKAARRAERQKEQERQRKYYNPDTPRYKRLRRIWWVLLGAAIVMVVLSFAFQSNMPGYTPFIVIALSYACIIGAFVLEFTVIRKERKRYADLMEGHKTKEQRAREKKAKAEERAQKLEAQAKFEAAQAEKAAKPKGLRRFFPKKDAASEQGDAAEAAASATAAQEKSGK